MRRSSAAAIDLERTVRALDTAVAIAQALGGETDLDRILELIVKRARALVGAATLVIMLEEDEELVFAAGAGAVPPGAEGKRMPIEGTVTGQVLRSQRSERVTDARSALHVSQELLGLEADTALLVPLAFRGRPVGVLIAFDHLGGAAGFDREDERLLGAFAASAATAVATGKSVEEQRLRENIAASEQERRRWARELHDETLQSLAGLRVGLSSARRGTRRICARRSKPPSRTWPRRSPACARSSSSCARPHSTSTGPPRRSRAWPSAPPRAKGSRSTCTSTSPGSAATSRPATPRSSRARSTAWCRNR